MFNSCKPAGRLPNLVCKTAKGRFSPESLENFRPRALGPRAHSLRHSLHRLWSLLRRLHPILLVKCEVCVERELRLRFPNTSCHNMILLHNLDNPRSYNKHSCRKRNNFHYLHTYHHKHIEHIRRMHSRQPQSPWSLDTRRLH